MNRGREISAEGRRFSLAGEMRRAAGFTLVELLVTITIIGIVGALAVSAVSLVQDMSKRTACVSNLRQWGTALQSYVGDNNGDIPRRGQGVQMVGQFNRPEDWFNALPPYLGSDTLQQLMAEGRSPKPGDKSVFVCPSATKGQAGEQVFLSYGMNMYLSQWNQPQPDNLFQIANPEQLAFMADSPGGYSSTIPSAAGYSVPARHNGHACVVFCDGHVESFAGGYLGCNQGAITHPDIRWMVTPDSGAGTPIR